MIEKRLPISSTPLWGKPFYFGAKGCRIQQARLARHEVTFPVEQQQAGNQDDTVCTRHFSSRNTEQVDAQHLRSVFQFRLQPINDGLTDRAQRSKIRI
jgi:hypothetical protein